MESRGKRLFKKIPRWRLALRLASLHAFKDDYLGSHWHDWEQRIKKGHKEEIEWIEKQSKNWTSTDYDFGDIYGEDYVRACELTNNMYAALIVSVWSEMENFLKSVLRISYSIRKEQKKPPIRIDQIIKVFENRFVIKIEKCSFYSTVNAIRLLNNSFKHDMGYCDPMTENFRNIKKSKITKIAIPDRRKRVTKWRGNKIEIKYSALCLEDIIFACNAFCTDLLKKVEIEWKKLPA